jgi:hypothetical protein
MNTAQHIQTEIRIADLVPLYENEDAHGRFMFICYAIAHKLNEQFQFIEGADIFADPYDEIGTIYGDHALSWQINNQAFAFMQRLGMPNVRGWSTVGDYFLENTKEYHNLTTGEVFRIPAWSHDFRRELLKHILKMDPDAVFTISLNPGRIPYYRHGD